MIGFLFIQKSNMFFYLMQNSRFQTSGNDPGGDFDASNSMLKSKNQNSFNQARKTMPEKTIYIYIYVYTNILKSDHRAITI